MLISDKWYEETAGVEEIETPLKPTSMLGKRNAGTPVTF